MNSILHSSVRAELDELRNEFLFEQWKARSACRRLVSGEQAQCEAFYRQRADAAFDRYRAVWMQRLHDRTLPDPPDSAKWIIPSGPDALAEPTICPEPAPRPSWLHRVLVWPGERLVEAGLWLYLIVHPHEEQPR